MQHRYAGDIGDYLKLAILRSIAGNGELAILWCLHPNESNNGDGRHIDYLEKPTKWRSIDPALFDDMSLMIQCRNRSIIGLEQILLPATIKFDRSEVPTGAKRRERRDVWFQQQLTLSLESDIIFVDPDNGIDLRPDADHRASAKHVTASELMRLAGNGACVVAYHHQTRRAGGHAAEIAWIAKELLARGAERVCAIRARPYSPRVFFLINADGQIADAAKRICDRHADILEWYSISNEPKTVSSPKGWAATVLTLYPEMFPGPLGVSIAGRALREGRWSIDAVQIRDFATDRHRTVDHTPAGGGAGMVMRADVIAAALDSVGPGRPVLAMTPRGAPLTQARVRTLAAGPGVTILCGRFEGIDERLFEARDIEQVSIGDYILSGGEMAALVLLDACIRLLPGVMGAASSGDDESFETGLLEYPQYTRPVEWEGRTIPEVLRSGDHARIAAWRKSRAEVDTRSRRPDLWERHDGARVQSPSGARHEDGNE